MEKRVMKDEVSLIQVERMFLSGASLSSICADLNADMDVVEGALRDRLHDWKLLAKSNARKITRLQSGAREER